MVGSAPKEIQGTQTEKPSNIVEFVPRRDEKLRESVVQHAQKVVGSSFRQEHATPPGSQPIPIGEARQRLHPGIHSEPPIDIADFRDRAEKLIGHSIDSAGTIVGIEEPSFPMETASGSKVVSFMKERMRRLKAA